MVASWSWLYIAYVLIIALLMASRIPHFSGKKIGRVPRDIVIVVLFGVVAGLLLLATFPMEMLIFFSAAYLATIPFAIRRFKAYEAARRARRGLRRAARVPRLIWHRWPLARASACSQTRSSRLGSRPFVFAGLVLAGFCRVLALCQGRLRSALDCQDAARVRCAPRRRPNAAAEA